jgi:hypothetical protein
MDVIYRQNGCNALEKFLDGGRSIYVLKDVQKPRMRQGYFVCFAGHGTS